MTEFIKQRELSRIFYVDAVRPLLAQHFPELPHTAGLLSDGSGTLGFDSEMSRDHDWGPAVNIVLHEADIHHAEDIRKIMARELPREIRGYATHYGQHETDGTALMQFSDVQEINHRVDVMSVQEYIWRHLRWSTTDDVQVADWLSFPSQKLRIITEGLVYHDGISEWNHVQNVLSWYPHDVWLYMMAASWQRIGQEDHLHGRAEYSGDNLGSQIIASRLVRDVTFLCFLQEKRYAPYPKWFGSAFQQLECASELTPILQGAQSSDSWQKREKYLVQAFEYVAHKHNQLGITKPVKESATQFFTRPFTVIGLNGFAEALLDAITDPDVRELTNLPSLIGSIDHFSDSTDLRSHINWREKVRMLYTT